jgi:plastocyanin
MRALLLTTLLLTGLSACGGGDSGGPPPSILTLAASSGNAQRDTVGNTLVDDLVVRLDLDGTPQAGQQVSWTAVSGTIADEVSTTDAQGLASTTWTLGTVSGSQVVRASASGAQGSPIIFQATALAGPPATLLRQAGNSQTADVRTPLPLPLQVRIVDAFANPVPSVAVTWQVTQGTATLVSPTTTSSSGIASTSVSLGSIAGAVTIKASAVVASGSPVVFSAVARALPTAITFQVVNSRFSPLIDTLAVGGTVSWVWSSTAVDHNVLSTGTPSFPSLTAVTNAPFTYGPITFGAAGVYRFFCSEHGTPTGGMNAVVIVR